MDAPTTAVVTEQANTGDQQFTVINAWHGPMRGRRVVAGRERECARFARRTAA